MSREERHFNLDSREGRLPAEHVFNLKGKQPGESDYHCQQE